MIFTIITIIALIAYAISLLLTFSLSKKERVTTETVLAQNVMRYMNCVMLITLFTSFLLALQETKISHPIGTFNNNGFLTDLMTLSFVFTIFVVFNLRIIRHFSQPITKAEDVDSFDKFILYLRPFKSDDFRYGKIVKQISKKSFGAVSIANPHEIIQNVDSDKIFADDYSWKNAVEKCILNAKFVILHIGKTEGCMWELNKCVEHYIGKTLFMISSQENYEMFVKFICEMKGCSRLQFPKYISGTIQVYYLSNSLDYNSWISAQVENKKSIIALLDSFADNRHELICEINEWRAARRKPLSNLFSKKVFPADFNSLSWCGISLVSYPFLARLNWQFWIIGIIIIAILVALLGQIGMIVFALILTIIGKRAMYVSYNWTGEYAVNSQINFMALIVLLSTIISLALGVIYLNYYPIVHNW